MKNPDNVVGEERWMNDLQTRVTTKVAGGTAVISVDGSVDRSTPDPKIIIAEMLDAKPSVAILDLSHAPLINSEGLDWLEQLRTGLEPSGVQLRVVAPEGGKVRRILKLMQYDRVTELLHSLAEALRIGRKRDKV